MDIVTLAKISGLPLRRLRYVLEHHLLPNSEQASRGRRILRQFTGDECFAIALAAALMEAGQRRSSVANCLAILAAEPTPRQRTIECPLMWAFRAIGDCRLEIGDSVNVRVYSTRRAKPFDTGWVQAATGVPLNESYIPFVMTSIDVTRLSGPIRKAAAQEF